MRPEGLPIGALCEISASAFDQLDALGFKTLGDILAREDTEGINPQHVQEIRAALEAEYGLSWNPRVVDYQPRRLPAAHRYEACETVNIEECWERLRSVVASYAARLARRFRPPADRAAIEKVERQLGARLPEAVRTSLRCHDGVEAGVFLKYRPMRLQDVLSTWQMLNDVIDETHHRSVTELQGPVRSTWWDPGWIPMFEGGEGDLLCLDTVPEQGGTVGQIVECLHETGRRRVYAPDHGSALAGMLAELEQRTFEGDEIVGLDYEGEPFLAIE